MKNNYKFIEQIEEEYEKISDKWMIFHRRIALFSTLAALLIELIMAVLLMKSKTVHASTSHYLLKYLFIPSCINVFLIFIIYIITHKYTANRQLSKYTVSLCFSIICFVLFAAHHIFPVLYFLCILPVILTAVYGDYKLTTATFICSTVGILIQETALILNTKKPSIFGDPILLIDFLLFLLVLSGFYLICLILINFERKKNAAAIKKELERLELQQALLRDGMTNLFNRIALQDELNEMAVSEHSYIFVMIDLDNFKDLNDTYGHLKGDHCLKAFAGILQKSTMEHPAFRFGGDEFCIFFKNESLDNVLMICEHIKSQLNNYTKKNSCAFLSASFGIAQSTPDITIKMLLQNADKALYNAKNTKNCISVYPICGEYSDGK